MYYFSIQVFLFAFCWKECTIYRPAWTVMEYIIIVVSLALATHSEVCRSGEQEVTDSIPGRDITNSLKMLLHVAAPRVALRLTW